MEENNKFHSEQDSVETDVRPDEANDRQEGAEAQANPEGARPSVDEVVDSAIPEADRNAQKPKKSWKKELREWIVSLAAALMVVFFIRNFLFQIIRVDGDSMYSTLLNNERLFVTIPDVKLNGVERGDIVICHYPNRGSTNFVKRAVGVPGDVIYRECGVTHVVYETTDENGETVTVDEMLDERMMLYFPLGSTDDFEAYTLGEDEYFVVGDNRYNSHDSRDWNDADPSRDVGPITGDMIVGEVQCVVWPLSSIRVPE